MEGKDLGVFASIFQSGSRTQYFYKIKDSHFDFEEDSIQNNYLFGWHVAHESDYKQSRNSQGYIDFSIAESRLCYKSVEICSGAIAEDRVSRVENRLSENEMPKSYFKSQNGTMESDQFCRFSLLDSTGSATIYAATANSSWKKESFLPV